MCSLRVTSPSIWAPLGVAGELWRGLGRLGGALGELKLRNTHICGSNEGSRDQLANAGWAQGDRKETAGRVQGGVEYGSKGDLKSAGVPRRRILTLKHLSKKRRFKHEDIN